MVETVTFNEELGITTVVLNVEEGQFMAMAKVSDEDKYDKDFGYELARKRALIDVKQADYEIFMKNAKFYDEMAEVQRRKAEKARKRKEMLKEEIREMKNSLE